MWSNEQEQAFQGIKKALISSPVLAYPDAEKDFQICCDASDYAIRGTLEQKGENGLYHVVARSFPHRMCHHRPFSTAVAVLPEKPFRQVGEVNCHIGVTYQPGKKHSNADSLSHELFALTFMSDLAKQELIVLMPTTSTTLLCKAEMPTHRNIMELTKYLMSILKEALLHDPTYRGSGHLINQTKIVLHYSCTVYADPSYLQRKALDASYSTEEECKCPAYNAKEETAEHFLLRCSKAMLFLEGNCDAMVLLFSCVKLQLQQHSGAGGNGQLLQKWDNILAINIGN
ncbi:putative Retrovirus polyprotein [Balamuthia mandrillaris]